MASNDSIISLSDGSDCSAVADTSALGLKKFDAKNSTSVEDKWNLFKPDENSHSFTKFPETPQPPVSWPMFSPQPNALPEILIVPPSLERKRVRRSQTTPAKTKRISLSINYSRKKNSTGPLHLRTVREGERRADKREPETSASDSPDESDGEEEAAKSPARKKSPIVLKRKQDRSPVVHLTVIIPEKGTVSPKKVGGHSPNGSLLELKSRSAIGRKTSSGVQKISVNKIEAILSSIDLNVLAKKKFANAEGKSGAKTVKPATKQPLIKEPKILANKKNLTNLSSPRDRSCSPELPCVTLNDNNSSTPLQGIRGVRLNRHFELLMKYRYNQGADNKKY